MNYLNIHFTDLFGCIRSYLQHVGLCCIMQDVSLLSLGLSSCDLQTQQLWCLGSTEPWTSVAEAQMGLVAPLQVGQFPAQGSNLCPLHCKMGS